MPQPKAIACIQVDHFVIRDGQVVKYEHWLYWNDTYVRATQITRLAEDGGFKITIDNPEHTAGTPETVADVTKSKRLHPDEVQKFAQAFGDWPIQTGFKVESLRALFPECAIFIMP